MQGPGSSGIRQASLGRTRSFDLGVGAITVMFRTQRASQDCGSLKRLLFPLHPPYRNWKHLSLFLS